MSTLTTPDELHASRASSSEHSLTTTHVDYDTASQSHFSKSLSDVEKSAFSVLGSSSASLKTDPLYVRHPDLVRYLLAHLYVQVEFEDNDPRNPVTYSRFKKWCITLVVCGFTGVTGTCPSTVSCERR